MLGLGRLGRGGIAAVSTLVCVVSGAAASRIEIDPALKSLSCTTAACDSIAVQVSLLLGETGADGFEFELDVTNATLVGWSAGDPAGNAAAGMFGNVDLQLDGTTLIGAIVSTSGTFDGVQIFDVAILDLQATGTGTTELRFLTQQVSCSTCNGGSGQVFTSGNTPNELLGVINVVPEPGSFGLVALGLLAVAARPVRRISG